MNPDSHLLYLYGIVPSGVAVPSTLTGVDGARVDGLEVASVQALVSPVDAGQYDERALGERMTDLTWVGERVASHEAVLIAFLEESPVVPMQPFSLHAGPDALRERVEPRADMFTSLLASFTNRAEWNVRIWLDTDRLGEVLEQYSDEARALREVAEAAGPGKQYLMKRKRDQLTRDLVDPVCRREVADALDRLSAVADEMVRRDPPDGAGSDSRRLAAQAALLVDGDRVDALRDAIARLEEGWTADEFTIDLTGPWPPYHFVRATPDER